MKNIRADILAICCIAGAIAIFFYQSFFRGYIPVPSDALVGLYHPWRDYFSSTNPRGVPFKNFLTTDPVRQQIPWRKIAMDDWKNGKLPLWNPFAFSGTPLAANIQSGAWYPLNIIFLFLKFPLAWSLLIALEPILAALFLYCYLRSRSFHPVAAVFGALTWAFSGFNVAWFTWGTIGHVGLWFPLSLLAIDHVIEEKHHRWIWTLVLSVSFSMAFLAGHSQVAFYGIVGSAGYALWRAREHKGQAKAFLWYLGVACVLFLLITSPIWMPMMTFFLSSSRIGEVGLGMRPGWFFPWQHLIQFFVPDFFGNPATLNYWGEWNYGEFIGYIGIAGMVLAISGMVSRTFKDRKFWIAVIGVSLLFALPTTLGAIPYLTRIPFLSSLQPTRLMVLIDFSLVMLAAAGLDAIIGGTTTGVWIGNIMMGAILALAWVIVLLRNNLGDATLAQNLLVSRQNLILPTALFLLFLCISVARSGVSSMKNKKLKVILWSGLVATVLILNIFDLFRFGWKFIPFTDPAFFFPATPALAFLQQQPKPFRIMTTDDKILPPNTSAYYALESVDGYDPLYSARYEEFAAALNRNTPDISGPFGFNRIITMHNVDSALIPLLNIRFVLSLEDIKRPFLKKVFEEGETRVYEYLNGLPRAYLADAVVIKADPHQILQTLFNIDYRRSFPAVIEEDVGIASKPLQKDEYAQVVSYASGEIRLKVHNSAPRMMVILTPYDARWRGTADGKNAPIYRVNYAFQGISLTAGDHDVVIGYH